jgi:cyclophilin family peptidyl-prolyl cis-trans isomerase
VVLKTTEGDIELAFYPDDAPKAVENFIRLAETGYYDGVTFHRVVKDFVIQAGDPTGTGAGGESIFGGDFEDELDPSTPSYQRGYNKGVLAMANRGPNTNSSQFFIMLANNPLPHLYTIFGEVTSGIEVVDKIGQAQVGAGDKPVEDIIIEKVIVK